MEAGKVWSEEREKCSFRDIEASAMDKEKQTYQDGVELYFSWSKWANT